MLFSATPFVLFLRILTINCFVLGHTFLHNAFSPQAWSSLCINLRKVPFSTFDSHLIFTDLFFSIFNSGILDFNFQVTKLLLSEDFSEPISVKYCFSLFELLPFYLYFPNLHNSFYFFDIALICLIPFWILSFLYVDYFFFNFLSYHLSTQ